MIIIDDNYNLIVVEDNKVAKDCKCVQLKQEQINTLLSWLTPEEVKVKKTMAYIEYIPAEGFLACQLLPPDTKTPIRLRSVASLYDISASRALDQLRMVAPGPLEISRVLTQTMADEHNMHSYASPLLYTLTFVLPDGSHVEANFMKDRRFVDARHA